MRTGVGGAGGGAGGQALDAFEGEESVHRKVGAVWLAERVMQSLHRTRSTARIEH